MADQGKQPMQASGKGTDPATPDGVNNPAGGGQSGGGAYPNPHEDKDAGHFGGGQSKQDYHGGPGGADNAATGANGPDAD